MLPRSRCWAMALLLCISLASVRGQEPAAPPAIWHWLPEQPVLVAQLKEPAQLIQWAIELGQWPELQGFRSYREFLVSTPWRRFQQFIGHVEKELGQSWSDLLQQASREGIVLALEVKINNTNPKPDEEPRPETPPKALLIVPFKDAGQAKQVARLLKEMGQFELERQNSKIKYEYQQHRGATIVHLGDQFAFAAAESYLLLANQPSVLQAALDRRAQRRQQTPKFLQALSELSPAADQGNRLAWTWIDLEQIKRDKNLKTLLTIPNNDPIPYYVLGGLLDTVRRSPWALIELRRQDMDVRFQIAMPAGQQDMNPGLRAAFAPAIADLGIRKPLNLPGLFYQQSFYLDLHALAARQADYLSESVRKEFQEFDKNSGYVLFGQRFSKIVSHLGARHLFVAAQQRQMGYEVHPKTVLPSFGLILELKDPDAFDRAMQPILRSVGLLSSLNIKMTMVEEKVGAVPMVGYRMVDNEELRQRDQGLYFNFSPCFARVGRHYVLSSTMELGRDLIQHLSHESDASDPSDGTSVHHVFSWAALGKYLESIRSFLVTQSILQEGLDREEAEKQFDLSQKLLERLGSVEASVQYGATHFRFELRSRLSR